MGLTRVCVMKSSHSSGKEIYISPNPHHPEESFKFPKRSFGKTKIDELSFQPSWFVKWPFLHYDEVADRVFCHTCMKAFKEKKMKTTKKGDPSFVLCILVMKTNLINEYTCI